MCIFVSLGSIDKFFCSFTGEVERCEHVNGMKKPALIPTSHIKPSTTKRGSKPEYVRPGRRVWSSTKRDRRPHIVVVLSKKGVPTKSVTVKKAKNVKRVVVVYRLTNGRKIRKVSVQNAIIIFHINCTDFTLNIFCNPVESSIPWHFVYIPILLVELLLSSSIFY